MPGLKQAPPTMLTRAAFVEWLRKSAADVYVWPYKVVPCACGDYNCHGWRLVKKQQGGLVPIDPREQMETA